MRVMRPLERRGRRSLPGVTVAGWSTFRRTTSAAGIWAAISTWLVSSRARILPSIGSDSPWLAMRSPTTPSNGARHLGVGEVLPGDLELGLGDRDHRGLVLGRRARRIGADCETMLRLERVSLSRDGRAPSSELGARGVERRLALVDLGLQLVGLEAREQLALGDLVAFADQHLGQASGDARLHDRSGRPAGSCR